MAAGDNKGKDKKQYILIKGKKLAQRRKEFMMGAASGEVTAPSLNDWLKQMHGEKQY